jgi:mannosyltransferase OCH1-like enzyme
MIPKIIHQLWKTNSIPDEFAEFVNNWKRLHPTWQYKLWTDDMLLEFVKTEYPNFISTYNKYPYNIQRVDAARYLILNTVGGVYADLDIEPIKPIDDLLTTDQVFATEHPVDASRMGVKTLVSNAFMAAAPNTTVFNHITSELMWPPTKQYHDKRMVVLHSTGPMFLTYCVKDADVLLLPSNTFFSRSLTGIQHSTPDQIYGIHHFASTWW